MVWMEPAAATSSVNPVFNDLDLQVVAFDGTTETVFYPNNLAAKDPDNTVEMVRIPDVDLYEYFNVRLVTARGPAGSVPKNQKLCPFRDRRRNCMVDAAVLLRRKCAVRRSSTWKCHVADWKYGATRVS